MFPAPFGVISGIPIPGESSPPPAGREGGRLARVNPLRGDTHSKTIGYLLWIFGFILIAWSNNPVDHLLQPALHECHFLSRPRPVGGSAGLAERLAWQVQFNGQFATIVETEGENSRSAPDAAASIHCYAMSHRRTLCRQGPRGQQFLERPMLVLLLTRPIPAMGRP